MQGRSDSRSTPTASWHRRPGGNLWTAVAVTLSYRHAPTRAIKTLRVWGQESVQRPKSPRGKKSFMGGRKSTGENTPQASQAANSHTPRTLTLHATLLYRNGVVGKLSEGLQSAVAVLVVERSPGSGVGCCVCRWHAREELQAAHRQRCAKHRRASSLRFLHGLCARAIVSCSRARRTEVFRE